MVFVRFLTMGTVPVVRFLHDCAAGSTEDEGDDVTDRLEDRLYCLVHNF